MENKGRYKKYFSPLDYRLARILYMIKDRCTNANQKKYLRYGGRGIRNELTHNDLKLLWQRYEAESMKRPSIDRLNVDGNYSIANCRFIELAENARLGQVERWERQKAIDQPNQLQVRHSHYRGKNGFTICGHTPSGHQIRIFTVGIISAERIRNKLNSGEAVGIEDFE